MTTIPNNYNYRLFVWGLFSRGIAAIYFLSFHSLYRNSQVTALAGKRGLSPLTTKLSAISRDIPTTSRYLRFPTLLWFNASDATLTCFPVLGLVLSFVTFLGGSWTPCTFGLTWMIYLSLDLPVGLKFPWDALLFEIGFLAQLLPPTSMLTSVADCVDTTALSTTYLPSGGVAWLYRLLLVRLMVGFGRVKFEGHKSRDNCYTQGFLISQPMPTVFGWLGSHMPFFFASYCYIWHVFDRIDLAMVSVLYWADAFDCCQWHCFFDGWYSIDWKFWLFQLTDHCIVLCFDGHRFISDRRCMVC